MIYYKKLACTLWRLRSEQAGALGTWWVNSSRNLSPKAGEDQCCSLKIVRQREWTLFCSASLFYFGLPWIEWGPLTLGRRVCFIQSTNSNVNLIQNQRPYRHTQTNNKPNIWAPCVPGTLTNKINNSVLLVLFRILKKNFHGVRVLMRLPFYFLICCHNTLFSFIIVSTTLYHHSLYTYIPHMTPNLAHLYFCNS